MPATEYSSAGSNQIGRSIFSLIRDQLNSMETHGLSGGGAGGSGGLNLDSFQTHVADCFLQLSSSTHDLFSLQWLRDLLDSFLRIHHEFKTLLILSPARQPPSSSTCKQTLSSSFRHFVDHLVCSSKRSHQQLQGTSKVIFMASKRSCDPIDPIVAPPLVMDDLGNKV